MLNNIADWVKLIIGPDFEPAKGRWVETKDNGNSMFAVIQGSPGGAVDMDIRTPRFKIILLGKRDTPEDSDLVLEKLNALIQATIDNVRPCGVANIRALGEPVGPGFTTENRAWSQVDFEVVF